MNYLRQFYVILEDQKRVASRNELLATLAGAIETAGPGGCTRSRG